MLDARVPASAASAKLASTLTSCASCGSRAQAGSPTIAARCTTASAPSQRVAARHRVADVALDDRHAALAQLVRPVRLTVQQEVEHGDLAPRL